MVATMTRHDKAVNRFEILQYFARIIVSYNNWSFCILNAASNQWITTFTGWKSVHPKSDRGAESVFDWSARVTSADGLKPILVQLELIPYFRISPWMWLKVLEKASSMSFYNVVRLTYSHESLYNYLVYWLCCTLRSSPWSVRVSAGKLTATAFAPWRSPVMSTDIFWGWLEFSMVNFLGKLM